MVRGLKFADVQPRFLEVKAKPPFISVEAVRDKLLGHDLNRDHLIPVEKSRLRTIFKKLDVDGDGLISAEDLKKSLQVEGMTGVSLKECRDMIWEVQAGKGLSLGTFANVYVRAKLDTTGCEPRRLYHFILYKLIDKVDDGDVTADEVYAYLFPQMRSEDLTLTMRKLFGQDVFSSENNKENEMTISVQHFVRIMQSCLWGASETMHLSDQRQNRPRIPAPPVRKTAEEKAEERRKDRQRAVLAEQHRKQPSRSETFEDAETLQRVLRRKRSCLVHGITDVWSSSKEPWEAGFQDKGSERRPLSASLLVGRSRGRTRSSMSGASAEEHGRHKMRSDAREEPPKSTKHGRPEASEPCSPVSMRTRERTESREADWTTSEVGSPPARPRPNIDKMQYRPTAAPTSDIGSVARNQTTTMDSAAMDTTTNSTTRLLSKSMKSFLFQR